MFKIYDGREKFYQWDLDRQLIVEDPSVVEVHFCNRTDNCSLVCETFVENGLTLVNVPNILLQTDWKIHVYAYDGKHTKHDECYEVISRTKPSDYVYTETEVKRYEDFEKRIEALEENSGGGGVGAATAESGEIFNDYERNKAINQFTHAEGAHTLAGAKGFRILDTVGETITHQSYQGFVLDSIEGLEVGDEVSVRVGKHYRNIGTIKSFGATYDSRENIVMLNGTLPSDFELASKYKEDNAPWYNSLWVEAKPEVGTIEIGYGAHAEGIYTYALLVGAHAEGVGSIASGYYAHAEGERTQADYCSHAEGRETQALGYYSHAEGHTCKATGEATHAEGYFSEATAIGAHSEGYYTKASGRYSHTEGEITKASGSDAHAEGFDTMASGNCSHAEGSGTKATSDNSHAEGYGSIASASGAHAEGSNCIASGFASHAQGNACKAKGAASHVEGVNNAANGEGQHVQGKHAVEDTAGIYAHIVGGGNWGSPRNIHTIDWSGNATFAGTVEGTALILKAPNGTRYKITVDNNGNLTTVKA